jgi:hypothetical protein
MTIISAEFAYDEGGCERGEPLRYDGLRLPCALRHGGKRSPGLKRFDRKEILESDDLKDPEDARLAADDREMPVHLLELLVDAQQDRKAGAVQIIGVGQVDDEVALATRNLLKKTRFEKRRRTQVNIATGSDDGSLAGSKNAQPDRFHNKPAFRAWRGLQPP